MSWWCNSYSSKVYVQVWMLPLSSGVSVRKLNIFFWFLFVFVWFGFVFWGWGLGRVVLWLLLKIQGYSNNKIYANKWCFDLGIIQCTMYHYNYVSGAEKNWKHNDGTTGKSFKTKTSSSFNPKTEQMKIDFEQNWKTKPW